MQPVYVKSGSKLELVCEGIGTSTLHWWKSPLTNLNYTLIDSNNENGLYTMGYDITGKEVVSLIKDNVTQTDEGSYMCVSPSIRSAPFSVEVYIIHGKTSLQVFLSFMTYILPAYSRHLYIHMITA